MAKKTGEAGTVKTEKTEVLSIKAPKIRTLVVRIVGTAPYVQNAFSRRQIDEIMAKHAAGSTETVKKKDRAAKDFDAAFAGAQHRDAKGKHGIPAGCFRSAMISACRLVGFTMTLAKLAVFIEADGLDGQDGTPLVYIEGKPEKHIGPVRNATGVVDIRCRPMWREWAATLRIQFDADVFKVEDVFNLISRVGLQVGIGEGRPDSKKSAGVGWGTFRVEQNIKEKVA